MTCLDDDTVYRLVIGELAGVAMARADEHLDTCGDCRAVVAMVARGSSPSGGADDGVLARGALIGRYVVGDAVGEGAMGVVYAAWDPELDRRVALKVLREDGEEEEGRAKGRMQREAQAMAKLAHPNVVTVHEVGVVEGRVFVAMELVAGRTLGEWAVGRGWSEVCDVMVEVGKGLAAAHAAGLVHRDVKPDNVIVGEDGRARIGDFGLARSPTERSGTGTGTGTVPATGVAGTPAYMAPEGLRGGKVDARSDQFGYCVTFFEALHGERPFGGRSWKELLAAIEGGKIVEGRRPVPRWLGAIVRRGLSAAPDDRWPSIEALIAAIAAKRQTRVRTWVMVAAAVAVASAATAAVAVAVRDEPAPAASASAMSCELGDDRIATAWDDGARRRVRAALETVDAPWAAGTADRVIAAVDGWAAAWAAADDQVCADTHVRHQAPVEELAVRGRCLELRRDELSALVERLAGADREVALRAVDAVAALPAPAECREIAAGAADPLPADPARRGEVERVVHELAAVRAALAVGDWRAAQVDAARLVREAEAAGHQPTLAEAALAQARALREGGDSGAADAAALASLWAAERGHDDAGAARAWLELAVLAGERRELDAADERAQHALAAVARAGDPPSLVAALQGTMGLIAYNRGLLDVAQPLLEAALAGRKALYGDDDVEVARAWSSLGSVARARGELGEARRLHEIALEIDRRRLGARHPDVARDLHNVAGVARLAGDLEAALARYREALAIEREVLGEEHVATALTRNSIGLVMMGQDKLDEAEVELEAARVVLVAKGHGDRAIAMHNLGLVAQRRGRHREALRWFAEAEAVYRETIGAGAAGPVRLKEDRAASERNQRSGTGTGTGTGFRKGAEAVSGSVTGSGSGSGTPKDVGVYGSGQAWP